MSQYALRGRAIVVLVGTLTAYIDDSGDEGFQGIPVTFVPGGPSRWFVIAAVVVPSEGDLAVATSINRIKRRLWPNSPKGQQQPLHWTRLKHSQKRVVIAELLPESFTVIAAAFEKCHARTDRTKFDAKIVRQTNPNLKTPLYAYTSRLLIERVTRQATENGRQVDLVFENRASLSIPALRQYLQLVQAIPGPYGPTTVQAGVIRTLSAQGKAVRKNLQVADACAGALSNALEPNRFSQVEDSYIRQMIPKFRRSASGVLWGYGLKLFPGQMYERPASNVEYGWMNQV
jgi:hypothetical protein